MDSKLPAKKRSHEAVESDDFPNEQEVAAMSRSERKRHREKKRRSDVNKGFDELMTLLLDIDPEVRAEAEERASKGQCKKSLGSHEDNVLSRVDLISTAIRVLKRVHGENEKHKRIVEDLLKGGSGAAAGASLGSDVLSRSSAGLGGAKGLESQMLHGGSGHQAAGPAPSWAERQALLSNPNFALGASSQAWESAQLRAAQAARYSSLAHLPGYQSADHLLSLRASAGLSSADHNSFLAQLSNQSAMKRSIIQNMLQQSSTPSNRARTEALYSALEGSGAKDPIGARHDDKHK